jgi:hypothetical protein
VPAQARIARVFADSDVFPGDPRALWLTDPDERERIAGYLRAGAPILMTTTLLADRLDPARGRAVGASYRTDGTWIWSDALTYYVRTYGLAPEDEFRAHIAGRAYACPVPDEAARNRALAALYAWFAR